MLEQLRGLGTLAAAETQRGRAASNSQAAKAPHVGEPVLPRDAEASAETIAPVAAASSTVAKPRRFNAQLSLVTREGQDGRRRVERVLEQHTKRWELEDALQSADGTLRLHYRVKAGRKRRARVLDALRATASSERIILA